MITSKEGRVKVTFPEGMVSRGDASFSNQGWLSAFHAMPTHDGIGKEPSNWLSTSVPGNIQGAYNLEEKQRIVLFIEGGEIGYAYYTAGRKLTYRRICSGSDFGCDWDWKRCDWMQCETKTFRRCVETTIYFSFKGILYFVPIDHMLDGRRSMYQTCDDVKIMKPVAVPSAKTYVIRTTGSSVLPGVYQAVFQYEDVQGNKTNWTDPTRPVEVGFSENDESKGSDSFLRIKISNLDKRYTKLRIAIIANIKGGTIIKEVEVMGYSTNSVTYDYMGAITKDDGIDISPAILFKKKNMWFKAERLVQKDGRAYFYKVVPDRNVNPMPWIMQSRIYGVEYLVSSNDLDKVNTFMPNETYSFFLQYNYADMTAIPAGPFTNSGGGAGTGENRFLTGNQNPESSVSVSVGNSVFENVQPVPAASNRAFRTRADSFTNSASAVGASLPVPNLTPTEYILKEKLEYEDFHNAMKDAVDAFVTKLEKACNCVSNEGGGCGCDCGKSDCQEDLPHADTTAATFVDFVKKLITSETDDKKSYSYSGDDLLEASKAALASAIDNAKDKRSTKPKYTLSGGDGGGGASASPPPEEVNQAFEWNGVQLTRVGTFDLEQVRSTETYPTTVDCSGTHLYGSLAGAPYILFKFPGRKDHSIVRGSQAGVPHNMHADNTPAGMVSIFGIGVEVVLPPERELAKPLSETTPFTVLQVERDDSNRTVGGSGVVINTFQGVSQNRLTYYLRHGVNSVECFDKGISNANGDRRGSPGALPIYGLYGPDFHLVHTPLAYDEYICDHELGGIGHRYGIVAKGKEPTSWTENRIDQRGARGFVNLNKAVPKGNSGKIIGMDYAASDQLYEGARISRPVSLKYRESCVLFQTDSKLPSLVLGKAGDPDGDLSFRMDGLDHEAPIKSGAANIVYPYRRIPNQYGGVSNKKLMAIGLQSVNGSVTAEGPVGDAYVSYYTFNRSGYPSDKNGEEEFDKPDPPYTAIFKFMFMNWKTDLPVSGDKDDKKNKANGYGLVPHNSIGDSQAPMDIYWAHTCSTLVGAFLDSNVNPHHRKVGNIEYGETWWPRIRGKELDANYPDSTAWQDAYIPHFIRSEIRQASKLQKILMLLVRAYTTFGLGGSWLSQLTDATSSADFVAWLALSGPVGFVWYFFNMFLMRTKIVEQVLDIPGYKIDEDGGQYEDSTVKGWMFNYSGYDPNFSVVDRYSQHFSIPDPYDVCKCDKELGPNSAWGCGTSTTNNEIMITNKQGEGSIDAWLNIEATNYQVVELSGGRIVNMFELNGDLWAHTTDTFWKVYTRDDINSPQDIYYANMPVLKDPVNINAGIEGGLHGTRFANAARVTPKGYAFVDELVPALYLFDGRTVKNLTSAEYKYEDFFKRYLRMFALDENPCYECIDAPGGVYYRIGYDPYEERLFLTKRDVYNGKDVSFTATFSFKWMMWCSFHLYIPDGYIWTRGEMFAIKGDGLWSHLPIPGKYGSFFGKGYDFEIRVPIVLTRHDTFSIQELSIQMQSSIYDTATKHFQYNVRKFFDKFMMYNSDQSTGLLGVSIFDRTISTDNRFKLGEAVVVPDARTWKLGRQFVNRLRRNVNGALPAMRRENEAAPFLQPNQSAHDLVTELGTDEDLVFEDHAFFVNFIAKFEEGVNMTLASITPMIATNEK